VAISLTGVHESPATLLLATLRMLLLLYNTKYVVVVVVVSVNVGCGQAEERVLLTGLHAVADIYCECCKTTLGWKYVSIEYLFSSVVMAYCAFDTVVKKERYDDGTSSRT